MSDSKQVDERKELFKRRVFGRGTIFLVISLLVIGGWQLLHPPKVNVQRQVEISTDINFKRKPSLSDLLSWSSQLDLKTTQEESLKKLLAGQERELKPLEAEIAKVMQEFNQFAGKQTGESVPLEQLKTAAQPISELSRTKRDIEQSFAHKGLGILEEKQKDKAEQLWQAKLARMKGGSREVANP